ncbi:MAG: hypothetical protein RMH81_05510 [Thermomicrobium sp.]|nr:hypothetical protein [Thermomicrobium sp.]
MGALGSSDAAENQRWEPPRSSTVVPRVRRVHDDRVPAGLRLDAGWIILVRAVVAGLYVTVAVLPERSLVLGLVSVVAAFCYSVALPVFRLPFRLRAASVIEGTTIGFVTPLAVLQAYLASPSVSTNPRALLLLLETTLVMIATLVTVAIVVERWGDFWSPLQRALVLWPLLVVPLGVFSSAGDVRSSALSLALGSGFLAATIITVVARLTPVAGAPWVIVAGTVAFVAIAIGGRQDLPFWEGSPTVLVIWVVQSAVGLGLFSVSVRRLLLRAVGAVRSSAVSRRASLGEG